MRFWAFLLQATISFSSIILWGQSTVWSQSSNEFSIPQLSSPLSDPLNETKILPQLNLTKNNFGKELLALPPSMQIAITGSKRPMNLITCQAFDRHTRLPIKAIFKITTDAGEFFEGISSETNLFRFAISKGSMLRVEVIAEGYTKALEDENIELGEDNRSFNCTANLVKETLVTKVEDIKNHTQNIAQESHEISNATVLNPTLIPVETIPNANITPKKEENSFSNLNLVVGKHINLEKIYFDQSSYVLKPESYPQLDELTEVLKQNTALKIEISGHTDRIGDARLNLALSENRARVVFNYLLEKGIDAKRLKYRGYGQTRPLTTNLKEEERKKNRRVEVVILEN
ncbi:OmpA family protein [Runella sp. MFBS21]|uniref:OmpA family protein n=1 Tax=Runella sp. MFBS21 TaxID=3034018 RepID=UPI0023F6884D|nr:OmpA family protein [Runella sp. MFBS21]MDF7817753.1 OmpA family protein [Runella sp. MFBS21]